MAEKSWVSLIAVLVAFNTIRLTIFNQRQEIEIQRLVGASNWFIRVPYLIEVPDDVVTAVASTDTADEPAATVDVDPAPAAAPVASAGEVRASPLARRLARAL